MESFQDCCVISLHLPKAGGTTLQDIFYRFIPHRYIYKILGRNPDFSTDAFQALSLKKQQHYKLILGHSAYALRHLIQGKCRCITLLRDPVERVVSEYNYIMETPKNLLHTQLVSSNMSLMEFVESDYSLTLHNRQTKSLALVNRKELINDPEKSYSKAIQHLESDFALIGTLDRFDEFLLLLRKGYGWKDFPYYEIQNKTQAKMPLSQIHESVIDKITSLNALDSRLYHWVSNHQNELIQTEGDSFLSDLEEFKHNNSTFKESSTDHYKQQMSLGIGFAKQWLGI